ncbi:unnamed protein product [Protopolystoma xenopodis]|uniref:Uncharacterized protein n=1 Tax=Protopolystoma xenopodis TaxID=117903 RepID=A0A3S5AKS1_9PLAT|nr:unnamed protein product [Protopolystoma xenopodis]
MLGALGQLSSQMSPIFTSRGTGNGGTISTATRSSLRWPGLYAMLFRLLLMSLFKSQLGLGMRTFGGLQHQLCLLQKPLLLPTLLTPGMTMSTSSLLGLLLTGLRTGEGVSDEELSDSRLAPLTSPPQEPKSDRTQIRKLDHDDGTSCNTPSASNLDSHDRIQELWDGPKSTKCSGQVNSKGPPNEQMLASSSPDQLAFDLLRIATQSSQSSAVLEERQDTQLEVKEEAYKKDIGMTTEDDVATLTNFNRSESVVRIRRMAIIPLWVGTC